MRTEELLKNIFRIPVALPNSPLKELNSYLIRDPVRSLLIDTGFRLPVCKEALLAGLDELGTDPGSVDFFLTHMHADHSGLSTEIVGENQRILISEPDGRLMERLPIPGENWADKRVWNRERDILAGMPKEIIDNMGAINPAVMFAPLGGARYTFIKDGDILNVGGYSLRCIHTPGHSPGHMCLWDPENKVIFSGDHVLFDITPNITAWPAVEDSLGDYLNSLRLTRELPVRITLPGHRKTGDFHSRIDELLDHHKKRLAEVEYIIQSEPGLTTYEIAGRMRWKIRAVNWDEFPASQKIFAVGECLSHLNYLLLRGLISRDTDGPVYRYRNCDGSNQA